MAKARRHPDFLPAPGAAVRESSPSREMEAYASAQTASRDASKWRAKSKTTILRCRGPLAIRLCSHLKVVFWRVREKV
jgi:hypothetical protein